MKTPLQAAQDIAHLINSRVQSPRIDEMETIIAGVSTPQHVRAAVEPLGPVTPELAAAFFDWDRARIRDSEELDDHEARARQDIIAEKTAALFAIGVRSFADLRLLVPVVAYWNSPGSVKSPDYPECVLEQGGEDEGEGFEPKSVAYLVRAVIGLLGMGGVASSIPVHARQDDPALAAVQERLAEVDRLHDEAKQLYDAAERLGKNRGADPALRAANNKADDADLAMTELSKRIFAIRPITLHNLKQRAVLAKYWFGVGDQGQQWTVPEQCTDWESEVFAHLIDGVLRIDAPPDRPSIEMVALPSPELATFRSALEDIAEFRRINPEPTPGSPGYAPWYAALGERVGLSSIAERILSGQAPPLDALAAIAREYVLLSGHPPADQITDAEAHGGIPDWVVARLVHALLPNNRRQFLGSLARGLLLPIGGGALALADSAKAASLQITQGALPLSADALLLRSLKRDLLRVHEAQDDYPTLAARTEDWRALMRQVDPVEKRIMARPATSWTDVVELAEVAWWGIAHRGDQWSDRPASVLARAVLSLGGGERFYLCESPERRTA